MSPDSFLFFKIVLAIQNLLWFYINFRITFPISVKTAVGVLIGIAFNLQITLASTHVLTILSLIIYMGYFAICLFYFV